MVTSSNESRKGGTKRQRIAPPLPVTVNDLSADLWCGIADYLPKTSRALLAVALTAPPASFRESGWKGQPNALSRAIISSLKDGLLVDNLLDELCEEARVEAESGILRRCRRYGMPLSRGDFTPFRSKLTKQIGKYYNSRWEVMDFVDIPVSLASRLSDDDVGAVLVCIDAKNNLTRLKLTHCFNVVGTGLGPLRGSTVIQCLDLEIIREFEDSWHRNEDCEIKFDEIMLSEGPVFEVLDAILWEEGNTLKRFQYPYVWHENALEPDIIKMLYGRNQIMRAERFNEFVSDHNAVVNKFACCLYFGSVHEGDIGMFLKVNTAGDDVNVCLTCGESAEYLNCSRCNEIICRECCETKECIACNIRHCPSCCADHELVEKVTLCDESEWCEPYCSTCRLVSCKNETNNCDGCRKMTFDALLEECNAKRPQIDAQRLEIERLKPEGTNAEAEQFGDNISPKNKTANGKGEDETGSELDIRQHCSRCNTFEAEVLPICGAGCNARYCRTCDEYNISTTFCSACDGVTVYCNECWLQLQKRRSDKNDFARCNCKVAKFDVLLADCNMKQAKIDSQREEIERLRQGAGGTVK